MKKRNKWKLILFSLPLVFLLFACKEESTLKNAQSTQTDKLKKTNIPTVFIHGYNGNTGTMKNMINRFEENEFGEEVLSIEVSSEGEILDNKANHQPFKKNNPMIRLTFEDNKSHQWNQANWLQKSLAYLKSAYQVSEINLVGFSMGGISSFLYLETYLDQEIQPKINKVVTVGAPFNDFIENENQNLDSIIDKGPEVISDQLVNYTELIKNIPKETSFLLIGGQLSESDLSDGTVPLSSSLGVYSLLSKEGYQVKGEVIYGINAGHSSLRKNEDVNKYISNFLWM